MPGSIKSADLARIAKFAQSMSLATVRIGGLRTRIADLSGSARAVTPRIARPVRAVRPFAGAQAITVKCQCACDSASKAAMPSGLSGKAHRFYAKVAEPVFALPGVQGVAAISASGARLMGGATLASGKLVRSLQLDRTPVSLSLSATVRLVHAPDISEASNRAISLAARAAEALRLEESGVLSALSSGGSGYPRTRDGIRRAISNVGAALKQVASPLDEALIHTVYERLRPAESMLARALVQTIQRLNAVRARIAAIGAQLSATGPGLVGEFALASQGWARLRENLQSAGKTHVGANLQMRPGVFRQAAIAAVVAAPIMPAPVLTAAAARPRGAEPAYSGSVVINSSPSITIQTNDATDMERRVLEALREHREALYDQWHREVRRRQRVEF